MPDDSSPNDIGMRTWTFVKRSVPAFLISYLFLITILIGTAQQNVVDGLKAKNIEYDYNVAVRYHLDPRRLEVQQNEYAVQLNTATDGQRRGQLLLGRLERAINIGLRELQGSIRTLNDRAACNLVVPDGTPAAEDQIAVLAAAASVRNCVQQSPEAGNPQVRVLNQTLGELAVEVQGKIEQLEDARLRIETLNVTISSLTEKRAAQARLIEQSARSTDIMAVLDVFSDGTWPLARYLVPFPPTLMGILVAFTSGLFGALLVTLILLVYPTQVQTLTRTTAYGERLLLGGLIALAVFVLLFSGVAVLNGSSGTAESQNVMAYAAIGILSGMFSDRAAAWIATNPIFDAGARDGQLPNTQNGEPVLAEPADTEPAVTEPADTEPAHTEPADTGPADTEPVPEPAFTEPAFIEPAATEPQPAALDNDGREGLDGNGGEEQQ